MSHLNKTHTREELGEKLFIQPHPNKTYASKELLERLFIQAHKMVAINLSTVNSNLEKELGRNYVSDKRRCLKIKNLKELLSEKDYNIAIWIVGWCIHHNIVAVFMQ